MQDAPHADHEDAALFLRLRQQGLVARFGSFAMRAEALQPVLDEACIVAANGLGTRFAKVMQYVEAEGAFLITAGVGWRDGVVGHTRLDGDHRSPAGYALVIREPVLSNRLDAEQRFDIPSVLTEHGIDSCINVLIQAGDATPFGVLEVDSSQRDGFSLHDIAFVQGLANTLAVAVGAQRRQAALRALVEQNRVLLAEKDLLMQEVHHRVMNSLNLVRSLLSLQAAGIDDAGTRRQLEAAAARIMTIAAVHRRLHVGGSVTAGDAAQYLRDLIASMDELLDDPSGIELDVAPFPLPAAELASLGLIVVELVTNAMKHGKRPVGVAVRQLDEGLEVAVEDVGSGFPADYDPSSSQGLGMRLVVALASAPEGQPVRVDRSKPHGRVVVRTGFGGERPPEAPG
jgi:two-component sensor histidine kinase